MRQSAQKVIREDPQVRKEQILDETIRIIGERGYYGFTVQELAKRCGLSNAGLLYYFGSKDLILVAALEELERRETDAVAPLIRRAAQRGEAGAAEVLELFRTIVAIGTAEPEILRLIIVLKAESLDTKHPAHKTFRTRDNAAQALFARTLSPFVAEPKKMARRVAAVLDGLGEQWIRSGQSFDIVEEWSAIADRLLPELSSKKKTPTGAAKKKVRAAPKRRK